jgi:heterodisulfide reductase subunit C2
MEINFELRKELVREIPNILKCFQCGTCVSGCPAEKYGKAYSPRRKILAALYGDKGLLSQELWKCTTCNSCNERCPQGVNPFDVIVKLKNYALKNGLAPAELKKPLASVIETGVSMPVTDRTNRIRADLGLPEIKQKKLGELVKDG